jgi:hypothetical protein
MWPPSNQKSKISDVYHMKYPLFSVLQSQRQHPAQPQSPNIIDPQTLERGSPYQLCVNRALVCPLYSICFSSTTSSLSMSKSTAKTELCSDCRCTRRGFIASSPPPPSRKMLRAWAQSVHRSCLSLRPSQSAPKTERRHD